MGAPPPGGQALSLDARNRQALDALMRSLEARLLVAQESGESGQIDIRLRLRDGIVRSGAIVHDESLDIHGIEVHTPGRT